MIEFYPQIKYVHILLAMLSGTLFAMRGGFALAGMRWPQALPVKWLSYTIDTCLLTAALMLLTILPWAMFANGWLTVKIAFLVAYVGLGIAAFRPACGNGARTALVVAAVLCFVQVYGIARAHDPWGWLLWFGS